jgi:hypothetical protein
MISSEVQRTLVKSPPELWTELSDPEALARHLGELGEIKITRTEPETLVEWEAEGTTGTVAIKASGWGTKVTLTVNRELPAPEAAEPSTLEETESAVVEEEKEKKEDEEVQYLGPMAPEGAAAPTTEIEAAPAEEGEAAAATEIEAAPADEGEAAPPEDEGAPACEGDAPTAEARPAPATEAARRAAGWPSAGEETGPAIESDLRAAESGEPLEDGLPEWRAEVEPWAGHAPGAATAQASPEREPRRGFLARLFGKRRRATPVGAAQPFYTAEPDPEAAQSQDPALELSEQHLARQEPVLDDEPTAEEESLLEPELEPTAEEEPPAEAGLEPIADQEPLAEAATEPQQQQGDDLAAELKAAEEIAAEQVTAVLTGVLDRLGAAHHRPFSRA